ncbi:MAG TPA: FixH family protein [Burkholderiales bacterium]|nr:FixH family protein [Burkholderiales bacterium]
MSDMPRPWYRQLWPWLLISGPAAVVVAGAATIWIAFASADGLVAEDYYRQGLAINKRIAREENARRLGITAAVELEGERMKVRLDGQKPEALFVHLAHATRAGYDVRVRLAPQPSGVYEGEVGPLPRGRWRVVIEDPRGTWRIAQEAS